MQCKQCKRRVSNNFAACTLEMLDNQCECKQLVQVTAHCLHKSIGRDFLDKKGDFCIACTFV